MRWAASGSEEILVVDRTQFDRGLADQARRAGVPLRQLGFTAADALALPDERPIQLKALRERFEGWLPAYMAGGAA